MKHKNEQTFFWGVASSGYQHEGGYNLHGPINNWWEWEFHHQVERSGRSVDFWNRYDDDFALAQAMGLNSYRIGIEWARIYPVYHPGVRRKPALDEMALVRYAEMMMCARDRGLEPLVTLQHFTHPVWLGDDPWHRAETADIFADYVVTVLDGINQRLTNRGYAPLQWFITVNEPNMLVMNTYQARSFPGGKKHGTLAAIDALIGMCLAHAKAYKAIHDLYAHRYWLAPKVTFNTYASDLYWMDKFLVDMVAAPSLGIPRDQMFDWLQDQQSCFNVDFENAMLPLERTPPYWLGMLVKWLHHWVGQYLIRPERLQPLLDFTYAHPGYLWVDYIAFDYYDPFVGNMFRFPWFDDQVLTQLKVREWLVQSCTSKWWDWRVLPQGIRFFVDVYEKDYPGRPIVIAENGMALRRFTSQDRPWREDAFSRSDYLKAHIEMVRQLCAEGKPLAGYYHWSITDNYEWGSYAPRFGLFGVDFDSSDLSRHMRNAQGDEPARTYARLIRNQRLLP